MAKKPQDDRVHYNWSGHVTLDTAMNGFFKEIMHKNQSIEVKFRHGLIPLKKGRNPLAAERSPRGKVKSFDFSVPPKQPEEPRWHYPEADLGILAKFPSQKEQFDMQREKDRIYEENVKRLEQVKAQREKEMALEQEKHMARINPPAAPVAPITSAKEVMSRYDDDGLWKTDTFKSSTGTHEGVKKSSSKSKKTFYQQPISTFKSLGASNPEMLSSWRAKRAADFINKQSNPLEPPATIDMDILQPFRPAGGTLVLKKSTKKLGGGTSLPALEEALRATNAEIERQSMKIPTQR